jgi:hypothetical protein
MPLLHIGAKTERDVLGGDRRPIVKSRLGPQGERHRRAVGRHLDARRDEAVQGVGLIERAYHQRIENQLDAFDRDALEDERVQAIEGIDSVQPERAALRGVGVDVVEVLEVGRILEIVEDRDAVARLPVVRGRSRHKQ